MYSGSFIFKVGFLYSALFVVEVSNTALISTFLFSTAVVKSFLFTVTSITVFGSVNWMFFDVCTFFPLTSAFNAVTNVLNILTVCS